MADEEPAAQHESLISSPRPSTQMKPGPDAAVHSARLHRSVYIVIITLCYATLATFAWVVTCLLTYKPISAHYYGFVALDSENDGYGQVDAALYHSLYQSSERYYKAARVVQSIVAVVTLPLASAVCARAAVAFLQHGKQSRGVTMRQTMVLADKSWNDISLAPKLFCGQWKRYGSTFLVGAIALNILGGILSPLQQLFLSTSVIKTPTWPDRIYNLVDISDHFQFLTKHSFDNGVPTTLTRGRLASTTSTDPQMRLWSKAIDCSSLNNTVIPSVCLVSGGQSTFAELASLHDPFWSQLPSGFSTGVIRQFAPRINSTATRQNITEDDFPPNCGQIPDALYIRYANQTDDIRSYAYSVEVCMPGNMSASPWTSEHRRQDFSEELYLNISLSGYSDTQWAIQDGEYYSKITVNTTGGYFELPNYMNGQVAGPLLDGDPSELCGLDCEPQGYANSSISNSNISSRALSNGTESTPGNATVAVSSDINKGPLLTTALALFGLGSFIDRLQSFDAFVASLDDRSLDGQCLDLVPFVALIRDSAGHPLTGDYLDPCITYDVARFQFESLAPSYLWAFIYDSGDGYGGGYIQSAFAAAAYLANEAWMLGAVPISSLTVAYDPGADIEIPVMSLAGIVLNSALLGLFLLGLLATALYSAWVPRWATQMDAFAMMRIGAAMADKLPLVVARDVDRVKVLDETPGWIGDATGGEGPMGELAIGAEAPLKRRIYRSYSGHRGKEGGR